MDTGREVRVEVVREDAEHDEIVVRRTAERGTTPKRDLIAVIDAHLPRAARHSAGTTERLLAADRDNAAFGVVDDPPVPDAATR
jgi:hypothetical protein